MEDNPDRQSGIADHADDRFAKRDAVLAIGSCRSFRFTHGPRPRPVLLPVVGHAEWRGGLLQRALSQDPFLSEELRYHIDMLSERPGAAAGSVHRASVFGVQI